MSGGVLWARVPDRHEGIKCYWQLCLECQPFWGEEVLGEGGSGQGNRKQRGRKNWALLPRELSCLLWAPSADASKEAAGKRETGFAEGFPDSSVGKESACNAGDPGLILGLGRFPGEGIGYPLQYSWASLVAQLVKNLPTVQETWVRFLGWEGSLEKGKATHSSILAWRMPWTV